MEHVKIVSAAYDIERAEAAYSYAYKALADGRFQEIDPLLSGFDDFIFRVAEEFEYGSLPATPDVSVVIVSHKASPTVASALSCLIPQIEETGAEVILVDNGNEELLDLARDALEGFKLFRPPFQIGCSGGRNLGARAARGKYLVFLDDDGIAEPGCVTSLVKCLSETGAIAVRGRVTSLTNNCPIPPHYNLGELRIPAFISCEGVSAWRKAEFLEFGGFHVVLAGHEGLELCGRMWRFFGPLAFVYEPSAVLRHDYAADAMSSEIKRKKQAANSGFVKYRCPEALDIHNRIQMIVRSPKEFYLAYRAMCPAPKVDHSPVSIITTARNASEFLEEYASSWSRQLPSNSQIVFVDDCSTDDTYVKVKRLFANDERLTLIRSPAPGRGAALNAAVEAARNDICLIADVDDISLPSRIDYTLSVYQNDPSIDYFSFLLFQEADPFRAPRPEAPLLIDLGIEALFGMPLPFPAFTFKKSRFRERFDETLKGGIDCDWLRRSLAKGDLKGSLFQYPMVYYRAHSGQISSLHNDTQKVVRKEMIHQEFERIIGKVLTDADREFVDILIDIKTITPERMARLVPWVIEVLAANEKTKRHNQYFLATALLDALDNVTAVAVKKDMLTPESEPLSAPVPVSPPPTPWPNHVERAHQLRLLAEEHISKKEYRQARVILREAMELKPERAIRRRIRSIHKHKYLRWMFKSQPYIGALVTQFLDFGQFPSALLY